MALAGLGILLAPRSSAEESTTTTLPDTTVTTIDGSPWWYSPTETQIGPTALIVQDLAFEQGSVVVRFELRDLAPPAVGRMRTLAESNPFFAQPREEPVVAPEHWVLETVNGEYEGVSESARAPVARFEVPEGFVMGTITGLRLEGYRMRMPYTYEIEVPPIEGSTIELDEGFSLSFLRILPQADTTIIHIDLETPSDDFTAGEPAPAIISGVGLDWLSYGQRQAGGQFGGQQVIRRGADLPETIRLQVRSTYWVPFETSIAIDLGGVRLG